MNPRDILTCIIQDDAKASEAAGRYDIQFHNTYVHYDGVDYQYHSSGLVRIVYISPERDYVLKIPAEAAGQFDLYMQTGKQGFLGIHELHNIAEAQCYQEASEEYKQYMAKTELLPMGWVKQEFVEVLDCPLVHNFREVGFKDDRYVLFDFDVMLDQFGKPYEGFHYENLPYWMGKAKEYIESLSK